jgi:hypothetical protein
LGTGVYLADSYEFADLYVPQKSRRNADEGRVMELMLRIENPYRVSDAERSRLRRGDRATSDAFVRGLQAQGHDSAFYDHGENLGVEVVVFDPARVRSVDAEFDPASQSENNLRPSTPAPAPAPAPAPNPPPAGSVTERLARALPPALSPTATSPPRPLAVYDK